MSSADRKVNRPTLLMQSAAKKLEKHHTLFALSADEYRVARKLVEDAVVFVNEFCVVHPRTKKMPRVFMWRGARYWLEYTTLGRVHVRAKGSKARFSSSCLAI